MNVVGWDLPENQVKKTNAKRKVLLGAMRKTEVELAICEDH